MAKQQSSAVIDGHQPIIGTARQPITTVIWLPRDWLHSNSYNPNVVPPPELALLATSIERSGWTQPIVVRPDGEDTYEIVDGFHRWTVSGYDHIKRMTDGLVPCVILRNVGPAEQRMATIRHNRARGNHYVLRMSEIIRDLRDDLGMTPESIMALLSMEHEEVDRLYDRGVMIKRGSDALGAFNKGWTTR